MKAILSREQQRTHLFRFDPVSFQSYVGSTGFSITKKTGPCKLPSTGHCVYVYHLKEHLLGGAVSDWAVSKYEAFLGVSRENPAGEF